MALWGFWGGFLAQWPTAKLHRFTVICFFSLYLSSFWFLFLFFGFGSIPPLCWLPFPVAASDLSAPKKCRARFGLDQQNNWCGPCRCVWCVLAPARTRWRLGNSMLGLPPLLSAATFSCSALPSLRLSCQAIVTSQLPPATPCRSISRLPLCLYEWCLCACVDTKAFLRSKGSYCRMHGTIALLTLVKNPKLAGRGLEDLEPDGLVNMEDIPVLPA